MQILFYFKNYFFTFFRSKVQEQGLFRDIEDMEWSASSLPVADDLYGENQPLPTSQKEAFEDITESFFHADQSFLADTGQLYDPLDFELLEGSFHEEDSLVRELLLNPLDETVQFGGGQTDYNIQLVKEKTLKTMGVKSKRSHTS